MAHPPVAHLRAALLGLILLSQGLIALPIGRPLTADHLAKPANRQEVERWMTVAGPLGWDREGFEDWLIRSSRTLADLDRAWIRPMTQGYRLLGIGQAWSLFATPTERPRRLEIHAMIGDDLHPLYPDPSHPTLAPRLTYRRIRGIYDNRKRTISQRRLTEHLATRLLREEPAWTGVRFQQIRRYVGTPGEDVAPRPDTTLRYTHHRGDLLPAGE